jgi:hypothetical protein
MKRSLNWKRIFWGCLLSIPLTVVFYLINSLGFGHIVERLLFTGDFLLAFIALLSFGFYAVAWLQQLFKRPKV